MKQTLAAISLIVALSVVSVKAVSAQSLVSSSWYPGVCTNLSRDLSYGARGSDVTELQAFLVAQDFPGGGSWMETGLFGAATAAAVRDFQAEKGLPQTGIADYATRSAISSAACSNSLLVPTTPIVTPVIPWNQYGNQYGSGYVSLNLTSLSQNTGSVGTQLTIYGTGFDATNNTINFGSVTLSGIPSNGTSITFTIPSYIQQGGTVNISVTDSRGTSNSLAFTVYGYNTCGTNYFSAYGSCGCNPIYGNSYYGNCGTTGSGSVYAPTISYLNPLSGGVGTSVTVFGSGFTQSGNTIRFGNGIITNLQSTDGQSLSFTVPSILNGYGTQNTGLGIYNVSVTNGDGYSTGIVPFTVTSLGTNGSVPSITSVNGPSSVAAGSIATWTVTINNPGNSTLTVTPNWGDANIYPYNSSASNSQSSYTAGVVTLTFTHVYSTNGTYSVSFTASNTSGTVTSAVVSVVVTGSVANGMPWISYLSPNSGYIGQQVTIYGSNFGSTDTILFGSGAIQNVYSNGSTITFSVPSSVGPYCTPGTACPQYLISITPGTYNVSVMNSVGTSNSVPFTVL